MKYLISALITTTCAATVLPRNGYVIHEKREDHVEHHWVKRESADSAALVYVRIGLTQQNLHRGDDLLWDISHPHSDLYGQHYTQQQIVELFAPSDETINAVKVWLEDEIEGISINVARNRQYLGAQFKVHQLEALVDTTYHHYEHQLSGRVALGCDHYHVPALIQRHIDFITPGLTFAESVKPARVAKRSPKSNSLERVEDEGAASLTSTANCSNAETPACIKALYNITDTVTMEQNNSVGIYNSLGNVFLTKDLELFLEQFAPNIPNDTYPELFLVDGAPNPKTHQKLPTNVEPALDIQVIYPLVYPATVEYYQVDDIVYETASISDLKVGLFNTWLDYFDGSYCNKTAFNITGDSPQYDATYPDPSSQKGAYKGGLECGVTKPPPVLSSSYSFEEQLMSSNYQRRQCAEFMKLGMQGVSVLGASGDYGVCGDRVNCFGPSGNRFELLALTNCPYITAVGATSLPPGGIAGKTPETATTFFPSAGGFSNVFPVPKYQEAALRTYFTKHDPPFNYYKTEYDPIPNVTAQYNRNGRGVPDVSANGWHTVTVFAGHVFKSGGTSAAAPLWAGIITRINAARLAAGKRTVGFINPTLYAHPEVFNDITVGNNSLPTVEGFNCTPGWDPVTGLGTPKYPALKALFMSLP